MMAIDWPKPIEIPLQARVSSAVNFIGRVKTPVQLDSAYSYGNHFVGAVISQEDARWNNPLLISIVFEGDLTHVVTLHFKENDRVYISGQQSRGPTCFSFNEGLRRIHLVAENLNFVEGSAKYHSSKSSVLPVLRIEKPLNLDEEKAEKTIK